MTTVISPPGQQPAFLPSLGMKGRWTLNAPYNSLVMATTQYACLSINSVQGAVAQGQNPLKSVYLANGDTEASFNRDLANQDYLITISSGPGDVVTFPRSAMVGLPDSDGQIYRNVMLGISLSAIPDSLNLDSLKQQIQALVLARLGVNSTVYAAQIGATTVLTTEQTAALEAARQARITAPQSLQYQNDQLHAQNAALIEQVAILTAYIEQHFTSVSV
jgi:hypothetical protein